MSTPNSVSNRPPTPAPWGAESPRGNVVSPISRLGTPDIDGQISTAKKVMLLELQFKSSRHLQSFAFSTGLAIKKLTKYPAELLSDLNRFRLVAQFEVLDDVFLVLLDSLPNLTDRLDALVTKLTKIH